jgi:hypothetical protein
MAQEVVAIGPRKEKSMFSRFIAEMRKFALVALYLFFFFGAFNNYRRLILREYDLDYFQYGVSLIEALVLGKVILLGEVFHLGDRFRGRPLIVPTLYRTFTFSLLVLAFAILEHLVKGLIHGQNYAAIVQEIVANRTEVGAKIIMMFIAFIPMFAIWEISNLFREGKLFELFFEHCGTAESERANMA